MSDLTAMLDEAERMALAMRARLLREARVPDVPGYPTTRREYVSTVGSAVSGYLEKGGRTYKNTMRRAVLDKFSDAFYRGYADAGGEETEDDDEAWLTDATNAELGNVDALFVALKALRDAGDVDADAEGDARAEGYAGTLDGVYSEGKMRGDKNKMLTFKRIAGAPVAKEPCAQCRRYDGQRHSAKWWIARGLVERNGNPNFDCGRWDDHCFHELFADDGEQYTR